MNPFDVYETDIVKLLNFQWKVVKNKHNQTYLTSLPSAIVERWLHLCSGSKVDRIIIDTCWCCCLEEMPLAMDAHKKYLTFLFLQLAAGHGHCLVHY
jgi:hypothetical protein